MAAAERRGASEPARPRATRPGIRIFRRAIPSTAQSTAYWSSNSDAQNPGFALVVDFDINATASGAKSNDLISAWCVRGGQGIDGVQ